MLTLRAFPVISVLTLAPVALQSQEGLQAVALVGKTDGLLGVGAGSSVREPFAGVELVGSAVGSLHWTASLAYARMTEANACCGPNPTLSYHYQSFLPALGLAYDFGRRALHLRVGTSVGPLIFHQSRSGTPPSGVGSGVPAWQWNGMNVAAGVSLHYEWRRRVGAFAGVRRYQGLSIFGPTTVGQTAPFIGASWRWR